MRAHTKIWRNESPDDITAQIRRAGASRRLTAEIFMGARVALPIAGLLAGFALADGPRRFLLAIVFAVAAIYLPSFILKKAATARADRIDAELPHFVDQLAIAIEAGMSFDAAISHLLEAHDGPLAEEMGRVMTELRVGEARQTALRNFADRAGHPARSRSPTPSSPPTTSARHSRGSSAPRPPTSGTDARCTPRNAPKKRR